MRTYQADTLTELHDKMCRSLIHAKAPKLDYISSVDVQIHHAIATTPSMEWDFDLKNLWLTPSRWTMMVRQYIPRENLLKWLENATRYIGLKGRGQALLELNQVKSRGGAAFGNKESRRWGGCIKTITYRATPRPQITLHSRTSYLGYLSGLDLSVAWMCASYLADELGCDVADFEFVWLNEAAQYHNFKSMAYLLNHPDPKLRKQYRRWLRFSETKLRDEGDWDYIAERPALTMTRQWLQKMILMDQQGKTLGDMTYNTYRRIRRRYHTEVLGYERAQEFEGWSYYKKGAKTGEQKEYFKAYQPLESITIDQLDLSGIMLPRAPGEYSSPDYVPSTAPSRKILDDED